MLALLPGEELVLVGFKASPQFDCVASGADLRWELFTVAPPSRVQGLRG